MATGRGNSGGYKRRIKNNHKDQSNGGFRKRFSLSTAIAAIFMGGYGGRSAYGGFCYLPGAPGT